MGVAHLARDTVNRGLRPLGVQVVRGTSSAEGAKSFIRARRPLQPRGAAGLPRRRLHRQDVRTTRSHGRGDRLHRGHGSPPGLCGASARSGRAPAGTRRETMQRLSPRGVRDLRAADGLGALSEHVAPVIPQPCDGSSLAATSSGSSDLVQARQGHGLSRVLDGRRVPERDGTCRPTRRRGGLRRDHRAVLDGTTSSPGGTRSARSSVRCRGNG